MLPPRRRCSREREETPHRLQALPAALAPLLREADESYAVWLTARDDYFGDEDEATAAATIAGALEVFVEGAVDAGMNPGEVVATLKRRFPEVPTAEYTDFATSDMNVSEDRVNYSHSPMRVYCSRCGAEAGDGAVVCVKCGCRLTGAVVDDGPSGGYGVLGFFFPLVGLILYLVWKDDYPLRARSCGTGAAWGFGVSMGSYVIYLIAMGSLLSAM